MKEKVDENALQIFSGLFCWKNLDRIVMTTRWTPWRRRWTPKVPGPKTQRRLPASSAAKSSTLPEENTTAGRKILSHIKFDCSNKKLQELWRHFLWRMQRQQDATSKLIEALACLWHLLHLADQQTIQSDLAKTGLFVITRFFLQFILQTL